MYLTGTPRETLPRLGGQSLRFVDAFQTRISISKGIARFDV